jgi:hypothetical protein
LRPRRPLWPRRSRWPRRAGGAVRPALAGSSSRALRAGDHGARRPGGTPRSSWSTNVPGNPALAATTLLSRCDEPERPRAIGAGNEDRARRGRLGPGCGRERRPARHEDGRRKRDGERPSLRCAVEPHRSRLYRHSTPVTRGGVSHLPLLRDPRLLGA